MSTRFESQINSYIETVTKQIETIRTVGLKTLTSECNIRAFFYRSELAKAKVATDKASKPKASNVKTKSAATAKKPTTPTAKPKSTTTRRTAATPKKVANVSQSPDSK